MVQQNQQQQISVRCKACSGNHIEKEPCYIQPLRRHVPASMAAPAPNEAELEFDEQLAAQPPAGCPDSSEDSMQEEEELDGFGGRGGGGVQDDDDAPAIGMLGRMAITAVNRRRRRTSTGELPFDGVFVTRQRPERPRQGPRNDDGIRPERLRYMFWDSECCMREEAGHPAHHPEPPAVDDDDEATAQQPLNPNRPSQRLYHDPLLVIAEVLCVPCMDVGNG
jgi:hypothetical protein